MIALNNCPTLNQWLSNLFQDLSIWKVGVGFKNDLDCLHASYPHMACFKEGIKSYIELIDSFRALHPTKRPGGLAGISEQLFGKTLCKVEQMSNWARRPLRKAQMHYAALDAHIQIYIWKKLKELIHDQGRSPSEFLESLNDKTENKVHEGGMEPKIICTNCSSKLHHTRSCDRGVKCKFCSVFGHDTNSCPYLIN